MIQITSVHFVGGEDHQHIQSVTWLNPNTNETGNTNKQGMIDWLRKGGVATVTDRQNTVKVRVVEGENPYFRTFADSVPTDNLLALPRY